MLISETFISSKSCKQCIYRDPEARGVPVPAPAPLGYCTKQQADIYFDYGLICSYWDAGHVVDRVTQITEVITDFLGTPLFGESVVAQTYRESSIFHVQEYSQIYFTLLGYYSNYYLDKPPLVSVEWVPKPQEGEQMYEPRPMVLRMMQPFHQPTTGMIDPGYWFSLEWKALNSRYGVCFVVYNRSTSRTFNIYESNLFGVIS